MNPFDLFLRAQERTLVPSLLDLLPTPECPKVQVQPLTPSAPPFPVADLGDNKEVTKKLEISGRNSVPRPSAPPLPVRDLGDNTRVSEKMDISTENSVTPPSASFQEKKGAEQVQMSLSAFESLLNAQNTNNRRDSDVGISF